MKSTKLPKIDLVEKELVVLCPGIDDQDYARVYKVMEVKGKRLTVEVISEIAINEDKYSQAHAADKSLVGRTFTAEASYFVPYM